MRLVGVVLAVFAVIVFLGFWADYSLTASTGRLVQNVALASQAVAGGRWDAAYGRSRQLETAWNREAQWWPLVLDHSVIDGARLNVGKLKEYIAAHESGPALAQAEELRLKLENIPDKEAVTLKNIL
ncbi:MAG: DUF4363 family protein [Peptococcaceae bacterium]|jgi:hypothetical protein|nr:DUF4363 family protein [Peptococcaceae bacterium]